jgi:hypothetical protein
MVKHIYKTILLMDIYNKHEKHKKYIYIRERHIHIYTIRDIIRLSIYIISSQEYKPNKKPNVTILCEKHKEL